MNFQSAGSGRHYEIKEGKDGKVYCTCKSCVMSMGRQKKAGVPEDKIVPECKHLKKLEKMTFAGVELWEGMVI